MKSHENLNARRRQVMMNTVVYTSDLLLILICQVHLHLRVNCFLSLSVKSKIFSFQDHARWYLQWRKFKASFLREFPSTQTRDQPSSNIAFLQKYYNLFGKMFLLLATPTHSPYSGFSRKWSDCIFHSTRLSRICMYTLPLIGIVARSEGTTKAGFFPTLIPQPLVNFRKTKMEALKCGATFYLWRVVSIFNNVYRWPGFSWSIGLFTFWPPLLYWPNRS